MQSAPSYRCQPEYTPLGCRDKRGATAGMVAGLPCNPKTKPCAEDVAAVALKLPSKRIPRRQKIVEEQHINETGEVFVRAGLKAQTQPYAEFAEKGSIDSPPLRSSSMNMRISLT